MVAFSPLGGSILGAARHYGAEKIMLKHKVLAAWPAAADAFVKHAGVQSKALEFKDGRLTVACLSGTVMESLRQMETNIIQALNTLLENKYVISINYVD